MPVAGQSKTFNYQDNTSQGSDTSVMNRWLFAFLLLFSSSSCALEYQITPTPILRPMPGWCYQVIMRPVPRCFPTVDLCVLDEQRHAGDSYAGCRAVYGGSRP